MYVCSELNDTSKSRGILTVLAAHPVANTSLHCCRIHRVKMCGHVAKIFI